MSPARTQTKLPCATTAAPEFPHGVQLWPLAAHRDHRGAVTEFFRAEWDAPVAPRQWVMVHNRAGVMRGVHVHPCHDDYFVLSSGRVSVGLCDLRPGSPSERRSALIELRSEEPAALMIPHGVAHGFLFHAPSVVVLGASHYYDLADELGCHWRDPQLGIAWPSDSARVSARDSALPPLRELSGRIPPWAP